MSSVNNRKDVYFKDLLSNGYSKDLIDNIKSRNFNSLYFLSITKRAEKDFMEPLLYATRNELGTFAIYKYYSESLQNNPKLGEEIIQVEPELLANTPLSNDSTFILQHLSSCPELINYTSNNVLINNSSEIIEIALGEENSNLLNTITQNPEITKLVIENNPELSSDENFMSKAIVNDTSCFNYLPDDLKNDKDFFINVYRQNKDIADYVIENSDTLSKDTLSTAKEAVIDNSSDEAINGFTDSNNKLKEELEKVKALDLEGNKEVSEQIEKKIAKNNRHIEFINKLKSGELDPVRAARFMKVLGKDMSPEQKREVEQILGLDEKILEKENSKELPKDTQDVKKDITTEEKSTDEDELTR